MADRDTRPLTDAERAELEELRAEKARRERAELEELRAQSAASASAPAVEPAPSREVPAKEAPVPEDVAPAPAAPAPASRPEEPPVVPADPGERTFGQRMVLSDTTDEDGLPTMPPAQRIIIVICILLAACAVAYVALTRAGVIG